MQTVGPARTWRPRRRRAAAWPAGRPARVTRVDHGVDLLGPDLGDDVPQVEQGGIDRGHLHHPAPELAERGGHAGQEGRGPRTTVVDQRHHAAAPVVVQVPGQEHVVATRWADQAAERGRGRAQRRVVGRGRQRGQAGLTEGHEAVDVAGARRAHDAQHPPVGHRPVAGGGGPGGGGAGVEGQQVHRGRGVGGAEVGERQLRAPDHLDGGGPGGVVGRTWPPSGRWPRHRSAGADRPGPPWWRALTVVVGPVPVVVPVVAVVGAARRRGGRARPGGGARPGGRGRGRGGRPRR